MAQYYESVHRTFLVDNAYTRGTRVKLSNTANTVTVAGPADIAIGVLTAATFTAGTPADVMLKPYGTRPAVASGAIAFGARVYPDANGQVTANPNGVAIGLCLNAATAAGDFIELLETVEAGNSGKLYTATSTTDIISGTSAATPFAQTYSVPANLLQVGDRLKIRAGLTVTGRNGTDTVTSVLSLGTVQIASTGPSGLAVNSAVFFDFDLVVRSIGSTGTVVGFGWQAAGASGTASATPVFVASATLNTTIANTITITETWSSNSATDAIQLNVLDIDRVPA